MTAETWKNTFLVGKFTCEMSFSMADGIKAEWSPYYPKNGELSAKDLDQYRAGRDAMLAEVAKKMGNILVVDVD